MVRWDTNFLRNRKRNNQPNSVVLWSTRITELWEAILLTAVHLWFDHKFGGDVGRPYLSPFFWWGSQHFIFVSLPDEKMAEREQRERNGTEPFKGNRVWNSSPPSRHRLHYDSGGKKRSPLSVRFFRLSFSWSLVPYRVNMLTAINQCSADRLAGPGNDVIAMDAGKPADEVKTENKNSKK